MRAMIRLIGITLIAAAAMAALAPRPERAVDAPARVHTAKDDAQPAAAGNGIANATLARAADGHFYADALVNGATVRFLVDSGASAVVLTRADAQRAGISAGAGEFTATGQGAGSAVALKPVTIDRIAIGPVAATGVRGAIAERELGISLLGQSFLSRVGHVEIARDEMRLR